MRNSNKNNNNAYDALVAIQAAVENNHNNMREEPDCEGETHDKWEEEDDALTDLEDALSDAVSYFEEAMDIRKSLRRMTI